MDLIQRRRELIVMQKSDVIDTSPKILDYTKYWWRGELRDEAELPGNDYCATIIMPFTQANSVQWIVYAGLNLEIDIFKDGQYIDYWGLAAPRLNANSNGVAVTLKQSEIEDAFLYINETGEIIFAGKNTPYYGHRNISELE